LNFLEKRWREKKLEGSEAVILFGLTRGVFGVDVRAVHAEKDKVFGLLFSFSIFFHLCHESHDDSC